MSSITTERISFSSRKQLEYPDLLDIQLKSFGEFFQLGTTLKTGNEKDFTKCSGEFPILIPETTLFLSFLTIMSTPTLFCRGMHRKRTNFQRASKAKLKLYCTDPEHEDFDTVIQDVYLGAVPYMTDKVLLL